MASSLVLDAIVASLVKVLREHEPWRREVENYVLLGNTEALSEILCATMAQKERLRVLSFLSDQVWTSLRCGTQFVIPLTSEHPFTGLLAGELP